MLPLFARQVKYFLASVEKNEWRMHTEVSIEIYSNDIFLEKMGDILYIPHDKENMVVCNPPIVQE